jgi:hypothetical protein
VRLARRKIRCAEIDFAAGGDRELVAVQVVAGRDLPGDGELIRPVEPCVHRERLVDRQQIVRGRASSGGRAADVEHARACSGVRGALGQLDRGRPVLWQIAQPEVGAALESELQIESLGGPRALVGNRDRKLAAKDFLLAKEFIFVSLATRERCGADRDAFRAALEGEAPVVQVEAFENREIEVHTLGICARRVLEHLLWRRRILRLRLTRAARQREQGTESIQE